jgi:hypothetical protein
LQTILYRSLNDCWSDDRRGEEVITVVDTGDEIIFPEDMFTGEVGYDKLAELYILLAFLNKTEHIPLYKADIEEITPLSSFEI